MGLKIDSSLVIVKIHAFLGNMTPLPEISGTRRDMKIVFSVYTEGINLSSENFFELHKYTVAYCEPNLLILKINFVGYSKLLYTLFVENSFHSTNLCRLYTYKNSF